MTSKQPFVFGVDLDGVCAEFCSAMRELAAEWLGIPLELLPTDEWNLDAIGGYAPLHQFAVVQRDLFEKVKPIPDGASATATVECRRARADGWPWHPTRARGRHSAGRSRRPGPNRSTTDGAHNCGDS